MKRLFLTAAVVLLAAVTASAEFHLDVKEYHLDNGLTILIKENHTAPIATYYTFYKVGARNESRYNSGISHFFEHMMFNGAAKYGPKMFDQALERNGGYSNAYTSKNVTAYYEVFPSDMLELILDLEADRMSSLALKAEMIESEAGVVSEERLVSTDNDNQGIMYEEMFATAFNAHSYQGPVLGWMKSIEHFNREDCVEYFKTYYAPNNAVVAVVGDVDADKTFELIKKYLGDLPSGPPPPRVPNYEPEQRGAKRVLIEKPAQHEHIMRGYHIGDMYSDDLPALEVIQFVMTTGESCRMHQTLVNDLELALYQWAGFSWGFDPELFYFYVAVAPGISYEKAEAAFDSVFTDLVTNGITEEELRKAQNSLAANFYKDFKTNDGTAHELARYQTFYGDWKTMYNFVDRINAVTLEQVKEAAAKYFVPKNSTTVVLVPEGGQS